MKRLLILCALPMLLAAEKLWPQRGDTVYVAAELHAHTPALPFMGGEPDVDVKACLPLRKVPLDGFKDDRGVWHKLSGDWSAYMFKSADECLAAVAAHGLPRVLSQGHKHRLVP